MLENWFCLAAFQPTDISSVNEHMIVFFFKETYIHGTKSNSEVRVPFPMTNVGKYFVIAQITTSP